MKSKYRKLLIAVLIAIGLVGGFTASQVFAVYWYKRQGIADLAQKNGVSYAMAESHAKLRLSIASSEIDRTLLPQLEQALLTGNTAERRFAAITLGYYMKRYPDEAIGLLARTLENEKEELVLDFHIRTASMAPPDKLVTMEQALRKRNDGNAEERIAQLRARSQSNQLSPAATRHRQQRHSQ